MTLKITLGGGLFGQASALVLGAVLAVSGVAVADSASRAFNIPAGSLSTALNRLAETGGLQLVYDTAITEGLQSKGINGNYTPEAALQQLLGSSGLSYRVAENGNIVIERQALNYKQDPTALPAVNVVARAASYFEGEDPFSTDYKRSNATTATRTDTSIMQTPMSVKSVPQAVLKDQQAITIDQALRNVSGVTSGLGGSGHFFIRGFGNYNNYRDGFLNQSQWAHTEDLENVERVEVLKGPGSILYGRTQPGGLVNFVTKQPLDTPYYSLRQQFGSFDLYRTSVDATGPLTENKDLAYRFNLGYQSNHSFQEFGGNERLMVAPTLRWNISDRTVSTFKLEYSDIKEMGRGTVPVMGSRPAPISRSLNLGDPWNYQEDEYIMLSFNTEHEFNDNWKLHHRFNFSNHNLTMSANSGSSVDPATGDVNRAFFAQNTDGNDYQHNFFNALELTGKFDTAFLKHTLLLGGDYYRTDYRASMAGFGFNTALYDVTNIYRPSHASVAPTVLPTDVTYSNSTIPWFGLYAQDQIELPFHVHVLAGLRYDNADMTSSSTGEFGTGPAPDTHSERVSPRGGVIWQPIPEFSLYGSYTENFGAPNYFGADGKPLPAQTADQWEVGAKTELFDGRLSTTLAYYDLTKRNSPIATWLAFSRAQGEAESRGIEFDLSGEILPGWNIIGAYSYMPFAKSIVDETDPTVVGKRLNNAPKHNGSLWTTYQLQDGDLKGLKLGAGMQALSQREIGYYETAQAPGYAIFNLMASQAWQVGKSRITAQLNVDNLLDKTYAASIYSYGPTYYGAPRTFMGAIKIEY
ncbi:MULTISPECIES: TonB-dependent siderophore receptor [Methylomonas]|uniref:TonB-dependent receptor n=2 Tax=Methylomonas TaxID=416 RepID=A0A126T3R5_9GAMM|nr:MULTISPECIES: TonB-dependent receptor [Methylomonas]AMK76726.1 TonB-dependent receptor [Methylomonas denitrificans]OAI00031.1 TonB-dependent receptor [Methylomonas methanica]TCV82781.1 iron complex outermembrane receptor protein [Methylomonas methanica]